MLHHANMPFLRAALVASCAAALVCTTSPEPKERAAPAEDPAPAVSLELELAALERLEHEATDLEELRGGDLHFDTEETVLLVLGVVLLIVLIA